MSSGPHFRILKPLQGGCVAEVLQVELADGTLAVAKRARGGAVDFRLEARMLRALEARAGLPVPEVLAAAPDLLLMRYLPHAPGGLQDEQAQRHAAELVATLHEVRGPSFGYLEDTVIGPLPQPNPPSPGWVSFFRDHRLLHMARLAGEEGSLPAGMQRRLEGVATRLGELIDEPPFPSLLHGDLWAGNILARDGRIVGFVDPAIHYGHLEVELAFATLFGSLGRPFFERYAELRSLLPGFFERRRHVYNLYPLLVHLRLFGSGYLGQIDERLSRLGF
jgi:fructosamine-3-kinase